MHTNFNVLPVYKTIVPKPTRSFQSSEEIETESILSKFICIQPKFFGVGP